MRVLCLLALVGCASSPPARDFSTDRQRLDLWDAGVAALERGEPEVAVQAFRDASALSGNDPALWAWEAKALADAGRLGEAIQRMDEVLVLAPGFAEARYNRAAWLARAGRVPEAAEELEDALDGLSTSAVEVLDDPDFIPHLDDPSLAFLPRGTLSGGLRGPEDSVFLGAEVRLDLNVLGAAAHALSVEGDGVTGPMRLIRVVEDVRTTTEGPMRRVEYSFQVTGAGRVSVSPLVVRAGRRETQVAGLAFDALAPEGRPPVTPSVLPLSAPSGLRRAGPLPLAWREGDAIWVVASPTDGVSLGAPTPQVQYIYRDDGAPLWVLRRFSADGERTVVVRNAGTELLRQDL